MRSPSKRERGFGGEREIKQLEIPNLKIEFAGCETVLNPAHVLLEKTLPSSDWAAGRLGADAMKQTHQISIDYKHIAIVAD